MWTIPHILSGALLAIGSYWIGFSFWHGLLLSTALLAAWESYEWLLNILEEPINVAADMVTGVGGFLLLAYWHYGLHEPFSLMLTIGVGGIALFFAVWGTWDFFKHGYR